MMIDDDDDDDDARLRGFARGRRECGACGVRALAFGRRAGDCARALRDLLLEWF